MVEMLIRCEGFPFLQHKNNTIRAQIIIINKRHVVDPDLHGYAFQLAPGSDLGSECGSGSVSSYIRN
jgi:hypothetical protein